MSYPDIPAAVLGEIQAAVSGVAVFDAIVTGATPTRYVLVHVAEPGSSALTVDGSFRDRGGDFLVKCVGSIPDSDVSPAGVARWLQRKVRDRLCGARLSVDGFADVVITANPVAPPPGSDEDVRQRVVVYTTDEFTLLATK